MNIIKSIKNSISVPYSRVLYALGIRHVGETVAKTISVSYRSIDELMKATDDELTSIPEIGPKISSSIISFFADKDNILIINRLRSYGLKLSDEDKKITVSESILISGVFKGHSREEYKEIIEKNGGKNSTSLSGNTSFILAGEDMGPSKKAKASELGIPLVSESEFLKLIGEDK